MNTNAKIQAEQALILACQAVLQSVGGTNDEATRAAHDAALKDLWAALAKFLKAR